MGETGRAQPSRATTGLSVAVGTAQDCHQQSEAAMPGESLPNDSGEELRRVDVGSGEGGRGSKLADDGQDRGCHGLI